MMNKEQLLQMSPIEIVNFLNNNIEILQIETIEDTWIRSEMIDEIKPLFDDTIKLRTPYYTNTFLVIEIDKVCINIKVSVKKTGKTEHVSRLKRKDIKKVGSFKFDDTRISFNNTLFEEVDLDKYIVKASNSHATGGPEISLKHRKKEKLIDMLQRDILLKEIEIQNKDWSCIKKAIVLNAAQCKIKEEYFKPDFTQEKWDLILKKTEEANIDLINKEIEKFATVLV